MDRSGFGDELVCCESARHSYKNRPEMDVIACNRTIQHQAMLTRIYVEAVLVDPEIAYRVWLLWAAGMISDNQAAYAWWMVAVAKTLN